MLIKLNVVKKELLITYIAECIDFIEFLDKNRIEKSEITKFILTRTL